MIFLFFFCLKLQQLKKNFNDRLILENMYSNDCKYILYKRLNIHSYLFFFFFIEKSFNVYIK